MRRVNDALGAAPAPAAADASPATADGDGPRAPRRVGLLDAFGFEMLASNSFEQLLINTTNERLQQFFIECVLVAETALYKNEAVNWEHFDYTDNSAAIALLSARPRGLLPALDDECRAPKPSDAGFAQRAQKLLLGPRGREQPRATSRVRAAQVLVKIGSRSRAHEVCGSAQG